jgi:RecA/RadA recombinase
MKLILNVDIWSVGSVMALYHAAKALPVPVRVAAVVVGSVGLMRPTLTTNGQMRRQTQKVAEETRGMTVAQRELAKAAPRSEDEELYWMVRLRNKQSIDGRG